jgi:hypothetical protein
MIFLKRFITYINKYNANLTHFVNGNVCGTVKTKYAGRVTYSEYSHNGYPGGAFVIDEAEYFKYVEMKNEYIHGLNVKVKDGMICCAGRFHLGKPQGYFIHKCKLTTAYIGAYYVNGMSQYVNLIRMKNNQLVSYIRITIQTNAILKSEFIFEKLNALPYEIKYETNTEIDTNYEIWRNNKLVKTYSLETYDAPEHIITYYLDNYKIILSIASKIQELIILKKGQIINKIENDWYKDTNLVADSIDESLYSYHAVFEWGDGLSTFYRSYNNVGDTYTSDYKYDKKSNQWLKCNIPMHNEN